MIATAQPTDEQIRSEFKEMMPELSSRFRYRFYEYGPDRESEFTAEAVALAWFTYVSPRRKGKDVAVTTLTWYSIRQALSGRRLGGYSSNDALSETTLARQRVGRHVGISAVGENPSSFYQVFGDRRARWTPLDLVQPKLDWGEFLAGCDQRDKLIVWMKLEGCPQTEIAAALGGSCPAVCLRLRALRRRWDARAVA